MTTNLVLGYPQIPNAASGFAITNGVASSTFPFSNLFGGNKTDLFEMQSATYSMPVFRFDLPQPMSADFLYIGRGVLLQEGVGAVELKAGSSTNYGAATQILYDNTFADISCVGPAADDYIATFNESASYDYWFIKYFGSDFSFPHAKLFFGKAFDIGRDPNAPASITRLKVGGAKRRATFSFEFSWEGVRYDKAVEMYQLFYRTRRFQPVILFTRDWHDILMGNRVLFCRITSLTLPPRVTDHCDITATFEELP